MRIFHDYYNRCRRSRLSYSKVTVCTNDVIVIERDRRLANGLMSWMSGVPGQ